jgi:cell fate (sporulation/competence/biofilm development) regulator YlbF (YheA/YmcA/DUF963 family)
MRRSMLISLVVIFVLAGAAIALAGCGTSSTEKAQTTYDNDVEGLKSAVSAFKDSTTYESVDNLQAAFAEVKSTYDSMVASAKDVTGAKISGVQDAYNGLKDAVANVNSEQALGQKIDAIQTAIQDLGDALQQL